MAQRRTTIYTRIKKGGKQVNEQEARKQLLQYEQSFLLAETREGSVVAPNMGHARKKEADRTSVDRRGATSHHVVR